jgi:hypothetical protein
MRKTARRLVRMGVLRVKMEPASTQARSATESRTVTIGAGRTRWRKTVPDSRSTAEGQRSAAGTPTSASVPAISAMEKTIAETTQQTNEDQCVSRRIVVPCTFAVLLRKDAFRSHGSATEEMIVATTGTKVTAERGSVREPSSSTVTVGTASIGLSFAME